MTGEIIRSLRTHLGDATRSRHDALDAAMGTGPLSTREGYVRFLSIQHSARRPLEEWAAEICPAEMVAPPQCGFIARDLAELGASVPADIDFAPPQEVHWLGLAWTLGGSSLGNRAMLKQRRRTGRNGPEAFLSDDTMVDYFRTLLPLIERAVLAVTARRAVTASEAAFTAFETAVRGFDRKLAA